MAISKAWLDFLREQYPVGSRIKLREMGSDDPCPIKPGSMGTLQYIDDMGTFFVAWDDGRGLGLIIGQDSFTVSPPPLQTLKLYMPLTVGYYVNEDGCGWSDEEYTMGASEAVGCAPQIINALRSEHRWLENAGPEEMERGLMAYYDEIDGVERKVQSYWFTAEVRDGRLWGVAECRVRGELTPDDKNLSEVFVHKRIYSTRYQPVRWQCQYSPSNADSFHMDERGSPKAARGHR